jgi:long-chain fatty acid transport protein
MMKNTMRTLPALLLAAFAGGVSASSFQLLEQNASGIGTAFAGSAAEADNASVNFYNPAGLTQLPGMQTSVGVTLIQANYEFTNQGSSPIGGGNGGNAGGLGVVPNAYFSWQLSPDVFLGFGVSSPFGLATEYDSNTWIGRVQAVKSEIKTINYNPSIAYRINDKVSVGFGLNYQTITAEMTSMAGANLYRVKGDDGSWGWNTGVLFTLSPAMRVGLSYRSAIKHELEGTRSLGAASVDAKAAIKLPDTFTLSVWQQVSDRWEAMGDFSYTNWSTLDKLNIVSSAATDVENFGYKDSWRLAWGAAYKMSDATKLKFGIAYDRTPTSNATRSARVPDNDRIWLSLGGQWALGRNSKVDVGYAYLYVKDPDIHQTKLGVTLNGSYSDSAHILGVQYSAAF